MCYFFAVTMAISDGVVVNQCTNPYVDHLGYAYQPVGVDSLVSDQSPTQTHPPSIGSS